jgi:glutaminyl-peptide cyclotransferase
MMTPSTDRGKAHSKPNGHFPKKHQSDSSNRALAKHWDEEVHPAMSIYKSPINSISLFLLLDLLGAKEPHIPSYFMTTHWAYKHMGNIERRMRKLGLLETKPSHPFLTDMEKLSIGFSKGYVQDDHVPFLQRGVEVLHIIPTPFPYQWHSIKDDGEHLDMPTVNDWCKIVTAFVAEWMELDKQMPKLTAAALKAKRSQNTSKTEL